jgi:hypothetical protein
VATAAAVACVWPTSSTLSVVTVGRSSVTRPSRLPSMNHTVSPGPSAIADGDASASIPAVKAVVRPVVETRMSRGAGGRDQLGPDWASINQALPSGPAAMSPRKAVASKALGSLVPVEPGVSW